GVGSRQDCPLTAGMRLLATQPTFTQVRPIGPPSIINAFAAFLSGRIAALEAAAPRPRMMRSYRDGMGSLQRDGSSLAGSRRGRAKQIAEGRDAQGSGFLQGEEASPGRQSTRMGASVFLVAIEVNRRAHKVRGVP